VEVKEFIDRAISEYGINWKEGIYKGKEGYYVKCKRFKTLIHLTEDAIKDNSWGVLNGQITQGKNISHITRIVGYYSRIENWNKSKIGELKDRQKGKYGV